MTDFQIGVFLGGVTVLVIEIAAVAIYLAVRRCKLADDDDGRRDWP